MTLTLIAMLALLLAPEGVGVAASPKVVQKKACCREKTCPTRCCVERHQIPPTQSKPAVPASAVSQEIQAAVTPVPVELPRVESLLEPGFPSSVSHCPTSSAVPLYVRTHSFLI
jgi:hypothetical protein